VVVLALPAFAAEPLVVGPPHAARMTDAAPRRIAETATSE
jgi:hypothetical protein